MRTLFIASIIWTITALGQSKPLAFRDPVHLPAGTAPSMLIVADVNHDQASDILVANSGSASVSVYLGDGKDGFNQAVGSPFRTGEHPTDIVAADFNGDGHPDLALPSHEIRLVTVLLGDGHGGFSFAPGSPFSVNSNPHPHGIAVADFNRDGKIDLAVDSWSENKVLVMFGNGDGTFRAPGSLFAVGRAPYQRLRSGDLNRDGNPDIVTSNWQGSSISVLLGNGKGGFRLADDQNIPVPPNPFGVTIGDFNGDGQPDIAAEHYSGHAVDPSKNGLSVLLGDGRGHFTPASSSLFPLGNYPSTVVAGDVDGDGIDDICIPIALDRTVTIYLGGKKGIRQAPGSPFPVGQEPVCVAVSDLNQDGKPDLVVADRGGNDILLLFGR